MRKAAISTETELIECRCSDKDEIRSWINDLSRKSVGLVIENGLAQNIAPVICDEIIRAGVRMVSVNCPHPHATYFGVDDYRAGFDAGKLLAGYAEQHWTGRIDRVIGLTATETTDSAKSRIGGAFEAIRNAFPHLHPGTFQSINTTRYATRGISS